MRVEILLGNKENPQLTRYLGKSDFPFVKYPKSGILTYFIKTPKGVIIFDPGSYYDSWKPVNRKSKKITSNVEDIIGIMREYFKGERIYEIIGSHYHFDHIECAPVLQKRAYEEFGYLPEIKMHKNEFEPKKLLHIFKTDLNEIFNDTGVEDYVLGRNLKDGEKLGESDYYVVEMPGHTSGSIGIINDNENVMLYGGLTEDVERFVDRQIIGRLIDECYAKPKKQEYIEKYRTYQVYKHHPQF